MFHFAALEKDGGLLSPNQARGRRLYRNAHNPYVGFLHRVKIKSDVAEKAPLSYDLMLDSSAKSNPNIGIFRHSPSSSSLVSPTPTQDALPTVAASSSSSIAKSFLGKELKGLIVADGECRKGHVLSQLHINRISAVGSTVNPFSSYFKLIPAKKFVSSQSLSESAKSSSEECDDMPFCSICLEPYQDGDEMFALACDHCFHNDCIKLWLDHQSVSESGNGIDASCQCPECRQEHVFSDSQLVAVDNTSTQEVNEDNEERTVTNNNPGISELSFLQTGQQLFDEGGYDFLSDIGSQPSSTATHANGSFEKLQRQFSSTALNPEKKDRVVVVNHEDQASELYTLEGSGYSLCGVPLAQSAIHTETDQRST